MFYIGQKVVCVDDKNFLCPRPGKPHVVEGAVYTIDSFEGGYLRVAEIHGAVWFARRFRPVASRKTDISIFTKMLTPNPRETERVS